MRSIMQCLGVLVTFFLGVTLAVHPVSVQGQDFIDTVTKQRFEIVGVDYQPGGQGAYNPQSGTDPLTDKGVCLRDAIMLQRLGVNTVRVYNVGPNLNHDDCASIFNAAGIYMILDVNGPTPGESINRAEPWTSYNKDYLERIFGVVENFKGYPNTLGFFAANEVMNDDSTGKVNPQYIRAVQRDLKNYIKNHANRTIPVGYSAADVREILRDSWAYLQCDNDADQSSSDFFGLNSYSWCGGDSTFETAGYDTLVDMFNGSAIPVFFSEYGCNKIMPRVFAEVPALYSKEMTAFSGGLVYEYSQEASDYGLVVVNENSTITLRIDYDNLQKQYNNLNLSELQTADSSKTSIKPPPCKANLITSGIFDQNFTIPGVCPGCDDLIKNGIDKPQQGKLVPVTDTTAPNVVYASNGAEVKGLQLNLLSNDASNTPSNETTSGTPTEGPAKPTETKKGAASRLSSGHSLVAAAWCVLLMIA